MKAVLLFLFALLVAVLGNTCDVAWEVRSDCRQSNQGACEAAGCCWDPTYSGGPAWCFYPSNGQPSGTPVFVMLPLNIVDPSNPGNLAYYDTLKSWLTKVKQAGAAGVMADFWWGIIEKAGPKSYNWNAYLQLAEMCTSLGLKLNVVTSFHQCGGNVGDDCNIPLPSWVLSTPGVYYTDQNGAETREYISLGADEQPLFQGRTPLQMYRDFFLSFEQTFAKYLSSGQIEEIEVGVGPSGELRYPAYRLDKWSFPGIGAFQCYDKYMLQMLKDAAYNASRPEWAYPPTNAGNYNSRPEDTPFFSSNQPNNWNSDYGKFFLGWYSSSLIAHGKRVLDLAAQVFSKYPTTYSIKISGVHWLYNTESHAAENTAGYYNVGGRDGYMPIVDILKAENASFDFTCLEMRNSEQSPDARSNPEALVAQTRKASEIDGVRFRGENALQRYDRTAYSQIIAQSRYSNGEPINGFTYLRLTNELVNNQQFYNDFVWFVQQMKLL